MSGRVVCGRITADPRRKGSTATECVECGRAVWATPSTLALIRDGVDPVCDRCAAHALGTAPIFAVTPEAAEEIGARRRAFAEQLGVPVERVVASLPANVEAAIDASKRRN